MARRNLVWSMVSEHLAFSVWLLMSVVVVYLPAAGFEFSVDQLFWLVAVPNLVGAVMRLPYTAAVARFGGRGWTVVSTVLLLVPLGLMVVAVGDAGTPYWVFLVVAATAGFGGGNFASSMANISYFFPERRKGFALGLNAAGGNVGVAVVQFVVPVVVGLGVVGAAQGDGLWIVNAPLVWVLPVVVAAVCAWLFMNSLRVSVAPVRQQLGALRNPHSWVIAVLYIGTFGSFIGYSAAFPLVVAAEFPAVAAGWGAAVGPLVGSLARPVGGWLADRVGGARVTCWAFAVMGAGAAGAWWALGAGSFVGFFGAFVVLFVVSGVGNGATFRMIPAIFVAQGGDRVGAQRQAAAVIGFASAVGALGGFVIPRGFGASMAATGSIGVALVGAVVAYAGCLGLTWWCYRRRVWTGVVGSLAHARV